MSVPKEIAQLYVSTYAFTSWIFNDFIKPGLTQYANKIANNFMVFYDGNAIRIIGAPTSPVMVSVDIPYDRLVSIALTMDQFSKYGLSLNAVGSYGPKLGKWLSWVQQYCNDVLNIKCVGENAQWIIYSTVTNKYLAENERDPNALMELVGKELPNIEYVFTIDIDRYVDFIYSSVLPLMTIIERNVSGTSIAQFRAMHARLMDIHSIIKSARVGLAFTMHPMELLTYVSKLVNEFNFIVTAMAFTLQRS